MHDLAEILKANADAIITEAQQVNKRMEQSRRSSYNQAIEDAIKVVVSIGDDLPVTESDNIIELLGALKR